MDAAALGLKRIREQPKWSVFVILQCLANFRDVGAMYTNGFVQLLACDVKLCRPIVDVGRKFRINHIRIVRPLCFRDFSRFRNFS